MGETFQSVGMQPSLADEVLSVLWSSATLGDMEKQKGNLTTLNTEK